MRRKSVLMVLLLLSFNLTGCKNSNLENLESSNNDSQHSIKILNKQDDVIDNSNTIGDSSDLLYREYQTGANMGEGKVICFKEIITDNAEKPQAIVVFYNDSVKDILPYEGKDIEYEIKKPGTYAFFVLEEDKSLVDISGKISDFINTNGSELLPLN